MLWIPTGLQLALNPLPFGSLRAEQGLIFHFPGTTTPTTTTPTTTTPTTWNTAREQIRAWRDLPCTLEQMVTFAVGVSDSKLRAFLLSNLAKMTYFKPDVVALRDAAWEALR